MQKICIRGGVLLPFFPLLWTAEHTKKLIFLQPILIYLHNSEEFNQFNQIIYLKADDLWLFSAGAMVKHHM